LGIEKEERHFWPRCHKNLLGRTKQGGRVLREKKNNASEKGSPCAKRRDGRKVKKISQEKGKIPRATPKGFRRTLSGGRGRMPQWSTLGWWEEPLEREGVKGWGKVGGRVEKWKGGGNQGNSGGGIYPRRPGWFPNPESQPFAIVGSAKNTDEGAEQLSKFSETRKEKRKQKPSTPP